MKFGQALSTRRDLLPLDIADELAKLQDRVPPFDGKIAARIEEALGRAASRCSRDFEEKPLAAASIAQVTPSCARKSLNGTTAAKSSSRYCGRACAT